MRLLNADIDDLYLLSKPTSIRGKDGDYDSLLVDLGRQIDDKFPNKFYMRYNKEGKIQLKRSSLTIKRGGEYPIIEDLGIRTYNPVNLLLTGVYTHDVEELLAETYLYVNNESELRGIKIIAGGYKKILGTKDTYLPNLLLLVPTSIYYEVDGNIMDCCKGEYTEIKGKEKYTLGYIMRYCEEYA